MVMKRVEKSANSDRRVKTDFGVGWRLLCSPAYLRGSWVAFIIGALGQMNHLLEVSTAIYFLICLRHNSVTFNNKHFSAKKGCPDDNKS